MILLKTFDESSRLTHDRDLQIATANTRNAQTWKNQQISLSEFVAKLSRTVRTQETVEQYKALPKSEQDNIKDVGGFVGGLLKGGKRNKNAVAYRSIMTLDADFAPADFSDIVSKKLGNCAWTIYSTHKHTPEAPRLRLIVYTDRAMQVDEYQAAMRKIAELIGINYFDDTTYDINRLMYYASTPADGDFVFLHNDSAALNVDDILAKYEDWQDVTQWPVSYRESKRLVRTLGKQADPMTKKGVVGAFCRTVSIYDAIDIVDVYTKETGSRYTYTEGTTSKGVVIYDDKFLYSNHDSDPAGGQTLNAFDLVRVHKFSDLDADAKSGTPTSKLPSFSAMVDFARGFAGVKQELIAAGLEIDESEFDDLSDGNTVSENALTDTDWLAGLQVADDGTIKSTFYNATEILKNDNKINTLMAYNLLAGRVENVRDKAMWSEKDSLSLRKYVGKKYQVDFPEAKIEQAITDRAHALEFHPVRDWLESLEWDGENRLETLLVLYLKCKNSIYAKQVAKCFMIAAVARAYEPGYKFDNVPVLSGEQGIGKSTFISILGKSWAGELSSFDHKIAAEEMGGKWILELTEMGAANRSELEQQKAFLSATSTNVRMAYARHTTEFKRQCVFIATTNQDDYLKDSSGNRRWWPISCGLASGEMLDIEALKANIDQIWAEAATLYLLGESTLLSDEAKIIAIEEQADKMQADSWEGVINEWLLQECDVNRYEPDVMQEQYEQREEVCAIEIWQDCLCMNDAPTRRDSIRISAIMKNNPLWGTPKPIRFGKRFGVQKGWIKSDIADDYIPF
ncbi:MAG: virulence-associated protein E [Methyloprofundus sp.]|nr:virulence-associated protein E [Methyloprofundus sp.]